MRNAALAAPLGVVLALAGAGCDGLLRSKEQRLEIEQIQDAVRAAPEQIDAPFRDGSPPLHIAVSNGYFDLLDWLLDRRASPNVLDARGEGTLHRAVIARREELRALRTLLRRGASPDVRSASGETALHRAAFHSEAQATELLLDAGADPSAKTPMGATALHLAATPQPDVSDERVARVVRSLVHAGADPSAPDSYGRTPLHLAALRGHAGAARALLREGALTNARSVDGSSALHVAAAMGAVEVAEALLAADADPNARDDGGRTPLAVALHAPAVTASAAGSGPVDTSAVVALLERHGGVDARTPTTRDAAAESTEQAPPDSR